VSLCIFGSRWLIQTLDDRSDMKKQVADLIHQLQAPVPFRNVFNPWCDIDQDHGIDKNGPQIRINQLTHYLESRLLEVNFVLIGEALGYQGGHFTGIAMTSERMLLGYQKERGILPHDILPDLKPKRTSKPSIKPKGFTEPTATIIWQGLMGLNVNPMAFVLWNAFAWHPFQDKKGFLSNRKPKNSELKYGSEILSRFLNLFPRSEIIAVGKVAGEILSTIHVEFHQVRHPAQGGAGTFREQISDLFKQQKKGE
jgi:hypothetical protein